MPEDAARLRVREFMSRRTAPTDIAFPGKDFAVSNIPIRVPTHFMRRDNAVEAIEAALKDPAYSWLQIPFYKRVGFLGIYAHVCGCLVKPR